MKVIDEKDAVALSFLCCGQADEKRKEAAVDNLRRGPDTKANVARKVKAAQNEYK